MTKEMTRVLDRIDAPQDKHLELGPTAISLDSLRAVYRDPTQQLSVRMRAAMACSPFETPKLLATAIVNEGSFAELLERRLKRMEQTTKLIEAKPTQENGGNADARLPHQFQIDVKGFLAPLITAAAELFLAGYNGRPWDQRIAVVVVRVGCLYCA